MTLSFWIRQLGNWMHYYNCIINPNDNEMVVEFFYDPKMLLPKTYFVNQDGKPRRLDPKDKRPYKYHSTPISGLVFKTEMIPMIQDTFMEEEIEST